MPHETALPATVAATVGLAFLFGMAAIRLRLPPLVGYMLAGVALGPFSPGWVADVALAGQLAELGVILLMFGVGLHLAPGDLLAVRHVAVPGAPLQLALAASLGAGGARAWGWEWPAALAFGLSLCVASTVVVLRGLEARGRLDSLDGRTAVGWLVVEPVVEDLAMVLVLVLLPAFASAVGSAAAPVAGSFRAAAALTLGTVAPFVILMVAVGRRAVPALLTLVARTGSRELFTLAVLAQAHDAPAHDAPALAHTAAGPVG